MAEGHGPTPGNRHVPGFDGASPAWIHGLGGALLVGRILHPLGMSTSSDPKLARLIGTLSTLLVLLVTSILLLTQQM